MTELIVYEKEYNTGMWSTILYYTKRVSKDVISVALTGALMFMLEDVRFVAVLPLLNLGQKLLKEKGLWY